MNGEKHGRGVEQAQEMLAVFTGLGVTRFDVTITDIDGRKQGFWGAQSGQQLGRGVGELIEAGATNQRNVIVRPQRGHATLVQLDDLAGSALERVRGDSFLILCTSSGNHQAWVAVRDCQPDFARWLRRGCGADPSASGAARLAGSINFKRKYAPDFPVVSLLKVSPGLMVTQAELQAQGLVAVPHTPPAALASPRRVSSAAARAWPNYQRCVLQAPLAHDSDRPDISRADFTFCLLAIDWGWDVEQTVQRLMQLSRKAGENGEAYAWRTAQRAAAAIARRTVSLHSDNAKTA